MSRTQISIATYNINKVLDISGLSKVDSFKQLSDDVIGLIALYTLPNIISKNELKIKSNVSESKNLIKAMQEQWYWFRSGHNWKDYLQKYMDDEQLIYLYNTLTNCKCCKRHQDYKGINSLIYLTKDRKCQCFCRHQKRWVERILVQKGYHPIPYNYNCNTETDWGVIQNKIATEYGNSALRYNN